MLKIISYLSLGFILFLPVINYSQINMGCSAFTSVSIPSGDFGKLYKGEYNIGGCISYSILKSKLDLTLSASYGKFGYKDSYLKDYYNSQFNILLLGFSTGWYASNVSVMVGAKYKLYKEGATPYLTGEIGMNFINFYNRFNGKSIVESSQYIFNFNYFKNYAECKSESGFATAFGGGLEIPLIENIYGDIGLKYNFGKVSISKTMEIIRNNNQSNFIPGINSISYISLKIGFLARF